ncbi:alpha/beta hydrolase [Paraphoma chrysanthemicola]|uniref:Alpha/beta hydrolase n=1 Tax=Paraphoma chrysanthemicola TaxID=798071 RepID=A0A8K0VWQ6_9PLEO|nr:alpha/beta hydrolase [Paraphoma chrysanthemicola]
MVRMQHLPVPHLGGIKVAYHMPHSHDKSKPTLVLIHGFSMSSQVFEGHFKSQTLTSQMNLLGIDIIGHGETECVNETFTYWDTAIMIIQTMDHLEIKKAFVLGTSHGGCIAVRTYLVAPDRIKGIIPIGALMDSESDRAHALGCWNATTGFVPLIDAWTSLTPTQDFNLDDAYCNFVVDVDFGPDCPVGLRDYWKKAIKEYYHGDAGRRKIRMAAINLRDRDGLHGRLDYVRCPVLWLHGTKDAVNSVANAEEEIKMFT